jgi:acetolactate synthase-1/2/3 large subunit
MGTRRLQAETVAEAFLALLADRGVDYLFANAGTDFPPVIEALAAMAAKGLKAPQPITVPHENLAMAMAHGHTLVSGRPQAVMVHVNVGSANALCGALNAARDQVPMLLAAGRTPLTESGLAGSRSRHIHWAQEMFDQAGMLREAVKWDYELRRPEQVEAVVDRALDIATSDPKGVAYLTLPREVLAEPHPGLERGNGRGTAAATRPAPDPAALDAAAEILARAERPLIVTAGFGREPAAVPVLAALAEAFALPVVGHAARHVFLPSGNPMHLGHAPGPLLAEADAVLVLDCDVPWLPGDEAPPAGAKVIHLGLDPLFQRYPIRSFPADLAIAGDTAAALDMLHRRLGAAGVDAARTEARRRRLRALKEAQARTHAKALQAARAQRPIHFAWASHCVDRVKDDGAIVINELALAADHIGFETPGTFFGPSAVGGLGWGLGAALGAKLAAPEREVIACVGDGSYMFGNPTPAHFVAQAQGLPVLFVVFNNAAWSAVLNATRAMYPEGHAMRANRPPLTALAPSPAFERVVEASGGYGVRVHEPERLRPELERALEVVRSEKRQALVNVVCRPR